MLATLLLPFKYNSIAVILFTAWSIAKLNKNTVRLSPLLALPAALFVLMCLSLLWSADGTATAQGLVRELPLLAIPLAFTFQPAYTRQDADIILRWFSLSTVAFGCFYVGKAVYRYILTGSTDVFYYHELAGDNAIYVSAIFSLAAFHLAGVKQKRAWHYAAMLFILACILLLASKTVVLINLIILLGYFFATAKMRLPAKLLALAAVIVAALFIGYNSKIKDRLQQEYASNATHTSEYITAGGKSGYVYDVSMKDAWQKPVFSQSDRFTGTSFRVYQARIFTEMLKEDNIFWRGYGLSASQPAIARKGREHNVFYGTADMPGYQTMNFHNQYTQTFAELGVAGFAILVCLLFFNLKSATNLKYFAHIAFAILMIALFLTESFIWRQRGVVFFTLLYCLFITIAAKEKTTV